MKITSTMKYVRLKDGIYEVHETESKPLRVNIAYWKKDGIVSIIRKSEVIKEAGTIRELCDEIVVDDYSSPNCKPFCYCESWDKVLNGRIAKSLKDIKTNIYGAIWVFDSNGAPTLKPVAKLNEEGELELLWTKWTKKTKRYM